MSCYLNQRENFRITLGGGDYPSDRALDFVGFLPSTAQLPSKTPQIPSNRDHKARNRGTLEGVGLQSFWKNLNLLFLGGWRTEVACGSSSLDSMEVISKSRPRDDTLL